MVEALYIAATQNQEAAVADYLERELTAQTLNLKQLQQHFRQDAPKSFPQLTVTQHDLSSYDQLIWCITARSLRLSLIAIVVRLLPIV